jgi:succinate dehydrogenase/fumarate reductase flavoprotein subunit
VSEQADVVGRSADTLVPLDLSRLYAIETWPGIAGTTGGPQHHEQAQVLRPDRQPVPGLYAAGAVSLVWGHLIEHGGGLTDALVFGQLAGANAAARAAAPRAAGPQAGGPQAGGPQSGGPQSGGPQSGGPQSGGPRAAGPQAAGPQAVQVPR